MVETLDFYAETNGTIYKMFDTGAIWYEIYEKGETKYFNSLYDAEKYLQKKGKKK